MPAYLADRRRDPAWLGCNVTMPHKQAALGLVDRLDLPAEMVGAVNSVRRLADGALGGTNTDPDGFGELLGGACVEGRRAIVLGAGGAARAILWALSARQIGRVTILNRDMKRAVDLLAGFDGRGAVASWGAPLPFADLLVNATPLGMAGMPALDVNLAVLPTHAFVGDVVYDPVETPLLRQARRRGLATGDGLAMLIGQAALAFEIFFGAAPPRQHDAELRALLTR
jgi:shikimate dehydrogenase